MGTSRLIFAISVIILTGIALFVAMNSYWNSGGLAMLGYLLAFFGTIALIPLVLRDKLNKSWSEK
ncbi:hypothetical protein [Saliphagus infecundisoli]|uniref:Uncharacterized protein n=1 Tax=Saliphagus infecundisoli TaxID=1849069 RepID=A0ABD5QB74_9EURY|nr:hypothetical protein [Saliphagus infecundisoli]